MIGRGAFGLMMAWALAGCAAYRPVPLEAGVSSLSAPDVAALSIAAAAVERPYLDPVALDLSAPLTPNEIAIIAVLSNPDLEAMRVRAGISDAQIFAAGLLPDPTFSLGVDHLLSGPDKLDNIAAALGFSINALRTRGVLREQARASARKVRLDLAWAEWQTAGGARLQAIRILHLTDALALARQSETSAQSLLARYMRAAGRGDIPADQVQAARLSALDAIAKRQVAESGLTAARYELHRLLGLPPSYPLELASQPLPPPPPDAATLVSLALTNRTDLQALRAGYAAQEASVHKAVLDQFPTLDLTINAARDTGGNKLLGPAVGLTLPLWNRNRGGIAIERATREALFAEYQARVFQTRADIAAAVAALGIARDQHATLLADLPRIEQFAQATRRAADRGDLSQATAETAEQAVRDRKTLLIQLEQAIAEQTIALELFVGAPQQTWTAQ